MIDRSTDLRSREAGWAAKLQIYRKISVWYEREVQIRVCWLSRFKLYEADLLGALVNKINQELRGWLRQVSIGWAVHNDLDTHVGRD